MSRALRSSCKYDTEEAPKRPDTDKAGTGELAVVKKACTLTFGSLTPNELNPDSSPIAIDNGKRRIFALDAGAGVKISPTLFRFIYDQPLPIRQPSRLESAQESDARTDAEAPSLYVHDKDLIEHHYSTLHGEATSSGVCIVAAPSALRVETGSSSATVVSAPAATNAPSTPSELIVDDKHTESSDNEDHLYSTARTSRVREGMPLSDYEGGISVTQFKANKILFDFHKHSKLRKSKSHLPTVSESSPLPIGVMAWTISCGGEARRSECPPKPVSLPNYHPNLFLDCPRLLCMSTSAPTNVDSKTTESNNADVDTFIHEIIDSYGISDEQHAEVPRSLHDETANAMLTCSQAGRAGSATGRYAHNVVADNVDEVDTTARWATGPLVIENEDKMSIAKGIHRFGNHYKIQTKCWSSGFEANTFKSRDQIKDTHGRSSGRFNISKLDRYARGIRSGSYLELKRGMVHRRQKLTQKPTQGLRKPLRSAHMHKSSRCASQVGSESTISNTCDARKAIPPRRGSPSETSNNESYIDHIHRGVETTGGQQPEMSPNANSNNSSPSSGGDSDKDKKT